MKLFHLRLWEAIRNDELQSFNQDMQGYFPRDQDGNPLVIDGSDGDGSVIIGYVQNKKRKAIRVWEKADSARAAHYAAADRIIRQHPSRFFTPFEFREKSLLLEQQPLDILITEWINHDTLKDYIFRCLGLPEQLLAIADEFAEMQTVLQAGGNGSVFFCQESIIVTSDRKLLIGKYNFQETDHSRKVGGFLHDSYASTLCMYISMKALSKKPHLWDRYRLDMRKELLFNSTDLADLPHSAIYLSLKGTSEEIDKLLEMLADYCSKNIQTNWYSAATAGKVAEQAPPAEGRHSLPETEPVIAAVEPVLLPAPAEAAPASAPADKDTVTNYDAPGIPAMPQATVILPGPSPDKKVIVITDSSLYERPAETHKIKKRPRRGLYGIAACLVLLLALGYFLKDKFPGNPFVSAAHSATAADHAAPVRKLPEHRHVIPARVPDVAAGTAPPAHPDTIAVSGVTGTKAHPGDTGSLKHADTAVHPAKDIADARNKNLALQSMKQVPGERQIPSAQRVSTHVRSGARPHRTAFSGSMSARSLKPRTPQFYISKTPQ